MKTIVVYRVEEVEPGPDEVKPHTWRVAAITAKLGKKIRLDKYFRGLANIVFDRDALGRVFFETPLQAINAFQHKQMEMIQSHYRLIAEHQRAIEWAQAETPKGCEL